MKKKWLENAQKRIDEKEEDNKRKMAAVKALSTGSKWQWNPAANPKEKQTRKKKTENTVGAHGGRSRAAKSAQEKDQKSKDV